MKIIKEKIKLVKAQGKSFYYRLKEKIQTTKYYKFTDRFLHRGFLISIVIYTVIEDIIERKKKKYFDFSDLI